MSTHAVMVVRIKELRPHPNAERLEITDVNGWQAIVRKGQFKTGDLAVYIEPDYVVPTDRPEFAFLAKEGRTSHRLKAVRLRGELSFGLLIPLPEDVSYGVEVAEGDNVMSALGITRYEPPVKGALCADELSAANRPWHGYAEHKFDIEALRNFADVLNPGEPVLITEKLHGSNARYLFEDDALFMGSRNRWVKSEGTHIWALAEQTDARIRAWCERNPGVILYGEIIGPGVQSLSYGLVKPTFFAFAAFAPSGWIDVLDLHNDIHLNTVPVLYRGPWHPQFLMDAEGDSTVPFAPEGHMREGVVVVPLKERNDPRIGRVALKHISNRYWESGE